MWRLCQSGLSGGGSSAERLVMPDHLANDEGEVLFRKIRIELGGLRQAAQARNLMLFALRIRGRQIMAGLERPDALGAAKPLRQDMNDRCIDIVDAVPQFLQFCRSVLASHRFLDVASMLKNVDVRPACDVQAGTGGKKAKGGLCQFGPSLALQQGIEFGLQGMQMQDIGGGIGELLLRERVGAPVRRLLLLGEVDPQKLAAKVLETEPIG